MSWVSNNDIVFRVMLRVLSIVSHVLCLVSCALCLRVFRAPRTAYCVSRCVSGLVYFTLCLMSTSVSRFVHCRIVSLISCLICPARLSPLFCLCLVSRVPFIWCLVYCQVVSYVSCPASYLTFHFVPFVLLRDASLLTCPVPRARLETAGPKH